MWTTRDGYELVLPRAGVDAVAARLAAGGAGGALAASDARRAVVSAVAGLAQSARRAPDAASPGRFVAARGARRYDIVARPIGARKLVITAVRPSAVEGETATIVVNKAAPPITVTWTGPHEPAAFKAKRPPGNVKGVYILYQHDGKPPSERTYVPKYVGQAQGRTRDSDETVAKRWQGRLRTFTEFGMDPPANHAVYVGAVSDGQSPAESVPRGKTTGRPINAIDLVEAVLVRQLLGGVGAQRWLANATRHPISNTVWARGNKHKVEVRAGSVLSITHSPVPPHVKDVKVEPKGEDAKFELLSLEAW